MANDIIHRQRLRGSSVQNDEYTGLEGEITVDLTNKNLRLHDGQTIGGTVIPNVSSLADFLKKTGDTMTGTLTFSNGKTIADYLPVSGGTITGTLILNAYNGGLKKFSNTGILTLFGGTDVDQGGSVRLYGKDHGSLPSQVMIGAGSKDLVLKPDGTMNWAGKEVERLNTVGDYYIRLESGLQVCWGDGGAYSTSTTWHAFPAPFANGNVRIACQITGTDGNGIFTMRISDQSSNGFNSRAFSGADGAPTGGIGAEYIAVGKWK